jgi:hypothetical protein
VKYHDIVVEMRKKLREWVIATPPIKPEAVPKKDAEDQVTKEQ